MTKGQDIMIEPWISFLLKQFDDEEIDEITLCDRHSLLIKSSTKLEIKPYPFEDTFDLKRHLQEMCFKNNIPLDPFNPSAGGVFQDCYRWHALLSPLSLDGTLFTLRKHRFQAITLEHFSLSSEHRKILDHIILNSHDIFICGPTGSGKTTFLSSLLREYFLHDKLVILEEFPELPKYSPSWIRLVTKKFHGDKGTSTGFSKLLRESLRLNPDHIIVGESRGNEIFTFIESSLLGHGSSMTTFHAKNKKDVHKRLELLKSKGKYLYEETENFHFIFMDRGKPPKVTHIQ